MAELARKSRARSGLKVKVLAGEQLERARMGGVLGVGKGSERAAAFRAARVRAARARRQTLALVGKGVVFDSGGLSLKTARGMETMKTDMSAARPR